MEIVDLSVPVSENTPVYPGDPKTVIKPAGTFDKDGYNDHLVSIGTHVGTHIDSPFHMLADGKKLDDIPIEQFIGRGCYVNAENGFDLAAIKEIDIQKGDIVLFHTGIVSRYQESSYYEDYPDIPEDVARYLVGKKIKMIGMDMSGPDHPPHNIHKILLGGGILIIENLTNLDKLAGRNFTVYALPIKLNLDGAPARVIAQLD
ncbi:MAG TPA: cyclase family protein [Candidatus Saccharimonadales bacterium]|nr:cyclase family protein [Candidatus Saccharimonadales bacterium]